MRYWLLFPILFEGCSTLPSVSGAKLPCTIPNVQVEVVPAEQIGPYCEVLLLGTHIEDAPQIPEPGSRTLGCATAKPPRIVVPPDETETIAHEVLHLVEWLCRDGHNVTQAR